MIITYNIVYCVCDEEFDSFCCWFTTMSWVMEHGGCRIASPVWQTKSLGARRQYSQATVNNMLPRMTDSPAFLTRPPNIAPSAWMHGTLWNYIYEFNSLRNRLYRYTTFQQWCGFSLSIGNSTGNAPEPWILVRTGMHMANEQYQQNSHKQWQVIDLTVGSLRNSTRCIGGHSVHQWANLWWSGISFGGPKKYAVNNQKKTYY